MKNVCPNQYSRGDGERYHRSGAGIWQEGLIGGRETQLGYNRQPVT